MWNRKLWGIELVRHNERPLLLGTAWMNPRPNNQYKGEPTRPILFMTRRQARDWCRENNSEYTKRTDGYSPGNFRPVRVNENVSVII